MGWRVLASAGFGLVLIVLTIVLSTVTASVLLALVVAAPLAPTVRGLRARGLSRAIASAVACSIGLVVFALVLILLIVSVVPYVREIVAAVSDGIADIANGLVAIGAPDAVIEGFERFVDGLRGLLAVNIAALAGTAVTVGTILVLASFLLYFVLQDGDRGWAWFMGQLEPMQASTLTAGATVGVERVGGYVRRVAGHGGGGRGRGGGAPAAPRRVAPRPAAGAARRPGVRRRARPVPRGDRHDRPRSPSILVAVAGPLQALLFIAGLGVAAVVEDRVLADTPIGRRVNVHPAIVVIAITAGAALYGILGLITAAPVTLFVLAVTAVGHRGPRRSARESPPCPPESDTAWSVPEWLDRVAQWSWRGLVIGRARPARHQDCRVGSVDRRCRSSSRS